MGRTVVAAYAAALVSGAPDEAIWHPESLFYFNEEDFDPHSLTRQANPSARAYHFFHQSSCDSNFDRNALLLNNLWSANSFAKRKIHLRFPYKAVDKKSGFGIEDWSWNIETVWEGLLIL